MPGIFLLLDMALSSISVIANSSLLKRYKITSGEESLPDFTQEEIDSKDSSELFLEKEGIQILKN